jgi:hypothetical protein
MFFEHVKLTRNMVGDEVAKGLAKFSQNSKYQPTTFTTTHPTAPSPSATPSTSATQPSYGMPLNYFSRQTPPAHKTAMTLYTSEPIPISSIPPTSAIAGQASIVPPIVPTGADNNTATGVRHAAPHTPPTSYLNETTARIWEGVEARLRDMGLSPISHKIYQKLYPSIFDSVAYLTDWRVPDFIKFDGEGSRTMWEHVSQYLAQSGEASSIGALRVRLFSLSLTGTAFAWFSSLPAYSIYGWEPLEQKFHEHFYSGTSEAKLVDLTTIRQTHDESASDYFKRFKETKNWCFNLTISEKDLADLAFQGMCSYLKEKLEGHIYLSLTQLQQFASVQENRIKNTKEIVRP